MIGAVNGLYKAELNPERFRQHFALEPTNLSFLRLFLSIEYSPDMRSIIPENIAMIPIQAPVI